MEHAAIAKKEEEGGPELLTLRETAQRIVEEGIAPSMSHQRLSKLAREDAAFPPVQKIGRATVVDWRVAKPYFMEHARRAAARDRRRLPKDTEGDS